MRWFNQHIVSVNTLEVNATKRTADLRRVPRTRHIAQSFSVLGVLLLVPRRAAPALFTVLKTHVVVAPLSTVHLTPLL